MSFVTPWVMLAGVLAAIGVVALHLLTTKRPPVLAFPTARFVPEGDVRAVARTSRPTDLLLLALRVLAVLALAAAFAQPIPNAPGKRVRRVVALEWTAALVDPEAARTRARGLLDDGDALVVYDTAARELSVSQLDSLSRPTLRRASLSPALVVAREAGTRIARGADSVELVLLGAVGPDVLDAATKSLRAAWPGRLRYEPLVIAPDTAAAPPLDASDVLPDDPLAPALAAVPPSRGAHAVRLARADPRPADAAWVREARGAVLVRWQQTPSGTATAPDGVSALDGPPRTLVAPLARLTIPEGRVIARWRDGTPAATEIAYAGGCERWVGVGLPRAGDVTLRAPFARFLEAMLAPCGGARAPAFAPTDTALAWLLGPTALASGPALATRQRESSPWTPWLLLAALLLLATEQLARRTPRTPEAA